MNLYMTKKNINLIFYAILILANTIDNAALRLLDASNY